MKKNRHKAILKVINENVVDTQEDLQAALSLVGFNVTQATVSRDIKELRIVKDIDANGIYRYIANKSSGESIADKLSDIFSSSVISVDYAINTVVIKCHVGMAQGACTAFDSIYSGMVIGTLAGDDTIFAIAKSKESADELTRLINEMLNK